MNFLAHGYLSFEIPEILAGNLISDFVKGNKKLDYPLSIQRGIMLHRSIDEFTDTHPETSAAKSVFKNDYGLYSGAFMDIVYDHFLANDTDYFPAPADLASFAARSYTALQPFNHIFPEKFQLMFRHMQKDNWFYGYRLKDGIRHSFAGLVHRAKYMHDHHKAFAVFEQHYDLLRQHYRQFFPQLLEFSKKKLARLNADL